MKNPLISTALPLLALSLCSCATAKSKNTHTGPRSPFAEQSFASSNRPSGKQEPLYGKFVVTAVNGNTVVFRQMSSQQDRSDLRIIVEYPAGLLIPQQGTVIERQKGAGFEVREVVKSQDGQTNLYVRDLAAQ